MCSLNWENDRQEMKPKKREIPPFGRKVYVEERDKAQKPDMYVYIGAKLNLLHICTSICRYIYNWDIVSWDIKQTTAIYIQT